MKRVIVGFLGTSFVALVVWGCGVNPASHVSAPRSLDPPAAPAALAAEGVPFMGDPNILLPESSVPRFGEMHTNHLIYIGPNRGLGGAATPAG